MAPNRGEGLAPSGVERAPASDIAGRAPGKVEASPALKIDELGPSRIEGMPSDRSHADLTLRDTHQPGNALADYELEDQPAPTVTPSIDPVVIRGKSGLDLDRLIGVPEDEPERKLRDAPSSAAAVSDVPRPFVGSGEHTPLLDAVEADAEASNLPLFGRGRAERGAEESPIVAPPRPAGPPLAVRRATPDMARPRNRSPRSPRRDEPPLSFPIEVPTPPRTLGREAATVTQRDTPLQTASRVARVGAALIDLILLGGICVGVLYLTLRIASLTFDDVRVLPIVPMAAFLILLVAGYLIAFTAAGGQTIGKMATGIRVIGEDGGPVDVASAVLRLAGNAVNIATLGLAWLPALFSTDGRSLADRLAGTRVVRGSSPNR